MTLKRVFQHHISVLVERPHHSCPTTRERAAARSAAGKYPRGGGSAVAGLLREAGEAGEAEDVGGRADRRTRTHKVPPVPQRDEDALIEVLDQAGDTREELKDLTLLSGHRRRTQRHHAVHRHRWPLLLVLHGRCRVHLHLMHSVLWRRLLSVLREASHHCATRVHRARRVYASAQPDTSL
jgi:hypothetical protein